VRVCLLGTTKRAKLIEVPFGAQIMVGLFLNMHSAIHVSAIPSYTLLYSKEEYMRELLKRG